jgi:hypothetical protein
MTAEDEQRHGVGVTASGLSTGVVHVYRLGDVVVRMDGEERRV